MSSQFVEASTSDTCDPLPSWQDGPPKQAVRQFVERATTEGSPDEIAPEDRIAVFDNDGTCGVRSRCRSNSTSSCAASSR